MSWHTALERLDRRWIFLVMALLVAGPLIFPPGLPLHVSPPVQAFHDTIARIPNGSTILMSCDYDPSARPEMVPMNRTAFRQLLRKDCKVVVTVLWPGWPGATWPGAVWPPWTVAWCSCAGGCAGGRVALK